MRDINDRCPYCGKRLVIRARENPNEIVVKVRIIRFSISGGPVELKCRHCGRFAETRFLRSYSE